MKRLIILACAAGLAGCTVNEPMEATAEEEAELAAELRDFEQVGEPVSCVSMRDLRGNRSAGNAIIFGGNGGRIWVNRPPAGCPAIRAGNALQIRTTITRLCRGDIAQVFDPLTGISYGGCGLGDFTPYERRGR